MQIQGEQGQTVGQVLQVASPTQQHLSGVTTTQLVQQGELTEEQHQQVRPQTRNTQSTHGKIRILQCVLTGKQVGSS